MRSLVVLALLVAGCSGAPSKPTTTTGSGSEPDTGPTPDVTVVITGKTILINGKPISGTPLLTDFIDVLGKPNRTWDSGGPNKIHTWDKIGVLVYEPKDGRAITATFPFKAMASTFTPKKLFAGSLVLDGNKFTSKVALSTIAAWRGATKPHSDASVVFDRGEFQVFTIEETPSSSIDLVELSFWQRGAARPSKPIRKPPPPVPTDALEEECKNGDASRCTSLALAFQTGSRGRKSPERAFELAKAGCTAGDPFACLMMGNMLDTGVGVAKAPAEAKAAWKRACSLGYKATCDLAK